jgi:hypothetical protein
VTRGGIDYWVVKLDGSGNKQWDRRYGGPGTGHDQGYASGDYLSAIVPTAQGGYLLGGWSDSGAGSDKSEDSRGERDYWLVHIAANGQKQWDKTLGGNYSEYLGAMLPTRDGGYLLAGSSGSVYGRDKSTPNLGGNDYWLVKLGPDPAPGSQFRINAGGKAFPTADHRKFAPDAYFAGGVVSAAATQGIAGTADDYLYQTGRHGSAFSYNFPTGNGAFDVTLHFSETYFGSTTPGGVGSRKFHVNLEGVRRLTDYDVFARAGGALRVRQETFRVKVTDGTLNVAFLKGTADNPAVKAIEVLPAGNAHALNAGGSLFTGPDGKTFSPDAYFANGTVSGISGGNVLNTTNDALYYNARVGPAFSYGIPAANGTYDLTLHFAETYFGARVPGGIGSRRFHLDVEGQRRLTDYDITAPGWRRHAGRPGNAARHRHRRRAQPLLLPRQRRQCRRIGPRNRARCGPRPGSLWGRGPATRRRRRQAAARLPQPGDAHPHGATAVPGNGSNGHLGNRREGHGPSARCAPGRRGAPVAIKHNDPAGRIVPAAPPDPRGAKGSQVCKEITTGGSGFAGLRD